MAIHLILLSLIQVGARALLIKEVWPEVKLLSYFEFYYNTINSDIDFLILTNMMMKKDPLI